MSGGVSQPSDSWLLINGSIHRSIHKKISFFIHGWRRADMIVVLIKGSGVYRLMRRPVDRLVDRLVHRLVMRLVRLVNMFATVIAGLIIHAHVMVPIGVHVAGVAVTKRPAAEGNLAWGGWLDHSRALLEGWWAVVLIVVVIAVVAAVMIIVDGLGRVRCGLGGRAGIDLAKLSRCVNE